MKCRLIAQSSGRYFRVPSPNVVAAHQIGMQANLDFVTLAERHRSQPWQESSAGNVLVIFEPGGITDVFKQRSLKPNCESMANAVILNTQVKIGRSPLARSFDVVECEPRTSVRKKPLGAGLGAIGRVQ